jgi:hypothetical protein
MYQKSQNTYWELQANFITACIKKKFCSGYI